MDFFSSMRVSASGLDAQTKRMNTISSNVANAETVGYQRKDPLMAATTDRESFGEILQNELDENVQGVEVQDIVEDHRAPRHGLQSFAPASECRRLRGDAERQSG